MVVVRRAEFKQLRKALPKVVILLEHLIGWRRVACMALNELQTYLLHLTTARRQASIDRRDDGI